jgi:hypothetical protein
MLNTITPFSAVLAYCYEKSILATTNVKIYIYIMPVNFLQGK